MNIQDSVEKLQKFFLENLLDPISRRTSKWIYTDEGRIQLDKSSFPKVLIRVSEPTTKELNAICSLQTLNTDIVEIMIKAKMGNHYGIGDKKYTGKEFVAYIGSQMESLLKDKTNQTKLDDFYSVLPIGDYFEYDKENNPTFVMRLQVKYID